MTRALALRSMSPCLLLVLSACTPPTVMAPAADLNMHQAPAGAPQATPDSSTDGDKKTTITPLGSADSEGRIRMPGSARADTQDAATADALFADDAHAGATADRFPTTSPMRIAVTQALADSPQVKRARAQLAAAQAHARELAAGPYEYALTGNYDRRRIKDEGAPERGYDEFHAQLLRPVRLPGKAAAARRQGGLEIRAAIARLAVARHDAALTLANHWFDLAAARENVALARRAAATQRQTLNAIQQQVAVGDAAPLDADRAHVELASTQARLARAQGAADVAVDAMSAMFPSFPMGAVPHHVPLSAPADGLLLAWRQRVLNQSYSLRAAQMNSDIAATKAQRANLDRYADPSVGLMALSEQGGNEVAAGVVAVIPFGSGSRGPAAERAAAEEAAAGDSLVMVKRQTLARARSDLSLLRAALATHAEAASALDAASTAVSRLVEGRRLGGVGVVDLLYAERQLHDAQLTESQSRADAARAIARLRIDAYLPWIPPVETADKVRPEPSLS